MDCRVTNFIKHNDFGITTLEWREEATIASQVGGMTGGVVAGGGGGFFGGAYIGAAVGVSGGPIGIVFGAMLGAVCGGVVGLATGVSAASVNIARKRDLKAYFGSNGLIIDEK